MEEEMSFTSLGYFPLLAATAVGYRFLPKKVHIWYLLLLSWWIYFLYGWQHFGVLLVMTGFSYFTGRLIDRTINQKWKKRILVMGVSGMVFFLFYSKWKGLLFGDSRIVPVGISFYMFQALSYLADIYYGEPAERSFFKYALYLGFFPQVVAGPIEPADHLIPQFSKKQVTGEDVHTGITYLLSGCMRKFVIADGMGRIVDAVYAEVSEQSGINLWLATIFFAIQIYGDFSGYTHIAIGSARMFGIRLTENFNRPYLAEGCRDFWKRWHMTLTQWFTKYLYIPLGGNRKKYRNIMIVFLVSGLWHGMDLTFLCWGAYFGILRIVEELLKKKYAKGRKCREESRKIQFLRRGITFFLVCLSWVFFRSSDMREVCEVFWRMFLLKKGTAPEIGLLQLAGAFFRIGLLAGLPLILKEQEDEKKRYYRNAVLTVIIVIGMLLNFQNGTDSSFIYFQF